MRRHEKDVPSAKTVLRLASRQRSGDVCTTRRSYDILDLVFGMEGGICITLPSSTQMQIMTLETSRETLRQNCCVAPPAAGARLCV